MEKGFEKVEPGQLDQLKEWFDKMDELTKKRHINSVSCGHPIHYDRLKRLVKGLPADPQEQDECHLCINNKKMLE
jgi:hypothetical protein